MISSTSFGTRTRLGVAVALVRFQVGHVLHAALNSLRHEQRFLLGSGEVREGFADVLAVPVVGDEVALPAFRFRQVDGHRGRPEFHRGVRACFSSLPVGLLGVPMPFVTSLVHRLGNHVNFASFDARNPLKKMN